MKNTRKILAVLLTLIAVLSLFACGGDGECKGGCKDKNIDDVCDVCGRELPTATVSDLTLVDGGEAKFQIVIAKDASANVHKRVDDAIVSKMKKNSGTEVTVVNEGSSKDTEQKIEILIGGVENRGEKYVYDRYMFGAEGYLLKIVDNKIILNAGSDKVLLSLINSFAEDVLRTNRKSVDRVVMTKAEMKVKVVTDYDVTSLRLNGIDMKGYVIATDTSNSVYKAAAEKMRDTIYQKTGYYFDTVNINHAPEKSIIIKPIDKVSGEESFRATVLGKTLNVTCAYDNMLSDTLVEFTETAITERSGVVNLTGLVFEKDISVVYYEDFGAKGNGITDDFKAFYDTHVFANGGGQTVMATPGKTYLIRDSRMGTASAKSIPIKTNVNWNGATIIIDDTEMARITGHANIDMAGKYIFTVQPDDEHRKTTIYSRATLDRIVEEGLKPGKTTVNLGLSNWDGDVMIIPSDSSHKVFRRLNYGQFKGDPMFELLIVFADGTIDPETPVTFNYTKLDRIDVYKLDKSSAITIENGNIITYSSKVNHIVNGSFNSSTINRGLDVQRSYTTVKNVNHSVVDGITLKDRIENGIEGPGSSGFFRAYYATDITFKDCEIPGRMCYGNSSTYNFTARTANRVTLDGCIQPNFWVYVDPVTYEITNATDKYGNKTRSDAVLGRTSITVGMESYTLQWGVGGTNYCKNLSYINSTLSRYDAHAGLYNGKIIGCNITDIELTGFGQFIIEDTTLYSLVSPTSNKDSYSNVIIPMRADYGYTWDGEILIKDVDFYILTSHNTYIMSHGYRNWYFGYTAAAANLVVDNLTLYDRETGEKLTGTEIYHMRFRAKTGSNDSRRMHLLDSGVDAIFSVLDTDGDGYVDKPKYDRNRDGVINELDNYTIAGQKDANNTSILYNVAYSVEGTNQRGVKHTAVNKAAITANLCIVKPPEYYKVLNNNNNYKFVIWDTSGQGISDGMWYSNADTMNGFFGSTKFYYGNSSYFTGTNPSAMPQNSTFVIKTPQ